MPAVWMGEGILFTLELCFDRLGIGVQSDRQIELIWLLGYGEGRDGEECRDDSQKEV